jgi:hypothetical protein
MIERQHFLRIDRNLAMPNPRACDGLPYSTVTDLARFRG